MRHKDVRPIPEDTASAGRAFFKKGTFYKSVGDQLGDLCRDCEPDCGQGAQEPHINIPLLFLVTVFQYLERLTDPQAADAVINRVDWKYALHLPLISLGFDQDKLDDYHRRLFADPAAMKCLDGLLERVISLHGSHPSGPEKVDTISMLEAVHTINRLSQTVRAMRLALEGLASHNPDWLKRTVLPHWFQRYARSGTDAKAPETKQMREDFALAVGEDGFFLLDALGVEGAPPASSDLPEVEYFRRVLDMHFERVAGKVKLRSSTSRKNGLTQACDRL